jgi:hypothetical protein
LLTAGELCLLEDVADNNAQQAHDEQEGDGETTAVLAALFP